MIIDQFGRDGIDVSGNNDVIAGNDIGTDPMGTLGLGNGAEGLAITGSNDQISKRSRGTEMSSRVTAETGC